MISSDLEGADPESRVASWAASATSDDAAAVRAVIEAYGDRRNKPGDDHDPRYRQTQPARLRQLFVLERTGGH